MIEIPLYFVHKAEKGGSFFDTPRIEVKLDQRLLMGGHPPHVVEYYTKVLKTAHKDIPFYRQEIIYNEWYFKKFSDKNQRDKLLDLLNEALKTKRFL